MQTTMTIVFHGIERTFVIKDDEKVGTVTLREERFRERWPYIQAILNLVAARVCMASATSFGAYVHDHQCRIETTRGTRAQMKAAHGALVEALEFIDKGKSFYR